MNITSIRPAATEYSPYHAAYVAAVPSGDILELLDQNGRELDVKFAQVPEDRGGYRYADGKWTIREVLGHLIDGERVLGYRALRTARGDTIPHPGYDAAAYVSTANAEARTLADLRAELRDLRESTGWLFASLPTEAWERVGEFDERRISVRALAYVIVGHAIHHLRALTDLYGVR